MRRVELFLMIAAVVIAASGVSAQSRNAATWYRKAVDRFAPVDTSGLFSEQELQIIDDYRANPSVAPTDQLRQLLARANGVMQQLQRGAREPYSDYDLDYSLGFNLTLPHLQPLRELARIMQADALVRLNDGDPAGAADRLGTIIGLSNHLSDDRTLISSLVGAHIFDLADESVQTGLDRASLSPADVAKLLAATKQLEASDPFGIGESLAMERSLVAEWMAADLADPAAREAYVENDGWLTGDAEKDQSLLDLSQEDFLDEVDRYEDVMQATAEAMALDDPEEARERLQEISEEVEAGEHGILALNFMPSSTKVFDRLQETSQRVAKRVEMLEAIAVGDVEPEAHANAAVYYERGIRGLRRLSLERIDALIAGIPPGDADAALESQMTSAGVQAVIDLFRIGASKKRCDFSFLHPNGAVRLSYPYVAGMRDALAVMRADVRRLMSEGSIGAATEVLAVSFGVIAHMGRDDVIMSAIVAQEAFFEAARVERDLAAAPGYNDEHRARLLDAARAISRKDPFGHMRCIAATRRALIPALMPEAAKAGGADAERQAFEDAVNALNANRLFYLVGVLDTVARQAEDTEPGDPALDPLVRVFALFDQEAFTNMATQAAVVRTRIVQGDYVPAFAEATGVLVDVDERRLSARKDVREVLIRLRPPAALQGGGAPAPPGDP